MAIDHVLKLYSKTIQSPFLHYGFWDDPEAVNPEMVNLDDIKKAQKRYIQHLAGFIPDDVRTILDVGAGIGGNAEYLLNNNYKVETLSPDTYQEEYIRTKFQGKFLFHHTKFEQFETNKKYDLILESESACYIKMDSGFNTAHRLLKSGGYLLASDYFIHYRDDSGNPHLKGSHDLNKYLNYAQEYGFKIIRQYDQTENTMPTLDVARAFLQRYIEPTVEYLNVSLKRKRPRLLSILKLILGKHVSRKMNQIDLVDSQLFRKYRKYMIFLFQKID